MTTVGTGADRTAGVVVPGVPACPDCEYLFTPACLGGPDETAACGNAVNCLEPGQISMRIWRRQPPSTDWDLIGTVCRGPGDEDSGPSIDELVRQEVQDLFDKPAPSYQPVRGAIVNLETIFASGQPASYKGPAHELAGFTVQIFAVPQWQWTFEPGVTESFAEPGGPYPDFSVTHTYTEPGDHTVELLTSWTAEYTVDGEGPFPVPGGPITQTAQLDVTVREARSVLVAD